ncbi:hypothetical protein PGSY75_0213800 [Plasmodium gaboni]|uniref:Uncharacterized protein n=1 Tax=Plasmodium gaboni TaxID=647221 RepID=A0A151LWL0_9APIC|nr:hypothetical protein PGSY75_0213800 [Plasmodium gaboni]KYO03568.1 hypothetical protein PGSY75_0213800 [Plasmodium gaboni]
MVENKLCNYSLRSRIESIFKGYNNLIDSNEELIQNSDVERDCKTESCLNKENYTNKNEECIRIKRKIFKSDNMSIFIKGRKYLFIENYTSVIYEKCEDKLNIILANKYLERGIIEVQLKGNVTFIIPCCLNKNILSCFLPQLERGLYHLFFFFNKERMFIKLLRPGSELSDDIKSIPLHVIEITDFSHGFKKNKITDKNKQYIINSTHNNFYTNKELIKLYNDIYNNYNNIYNDEYKRNNKISLQNNFYLYNNNEEHFYNFLNCYKDQFIDHSSFTTKIRNSYQHNKNTIIKEKENNTIVDINNMNFISQLHLEKHVAQSRIPILYKRLLYDNCIYENKMVIMHFHTKIFEYNPFNILSTHIFTKSEIEKDGYIIFAFNIIPITLNPNKNKIKYNNSYHNQNIYKKINYSSNILNSSGEKNEEIGNSYLSTLFILNSDERNCVDIRLWKYIKTVECNKNDISNNFYLSKNNYKNVVCPISPQLINNKNIFKRYSEGLKISDKVSIFFEDWNEDILPVQKFVNSIEYDIPYKKLNELSNYVENINGDILLFNDLKENGKYDSMCDENIKSQDESINDYQYNNNLTEVITNTSMNQNNFYIKDIEKKEIKHKDKMNKISINYLLNNFVSFVLIIDEKIYHSVTPINKFILLFIINYWMNFVEK